MFLLRPPYLLRCRLIFERKNVCNSQENGVRTRCAAIVNHSAIVNSLLVVNLLCIVFLVRRGPLGCPWDKPGFSPYFTQWKPSLSQGQTQFVPGTNRWRRETEKVYVLNVYVPSLKTLTSLNKEVRPFFLSDNSIWSYPSIFPLAITALRGPERCFSLAIIVFRAFRFIVPKYYCRLGKMEFEESSLLII